MNFYPHFLGDYQRDTAHLSLVEHGAYRVMLDTYYATEKPLPADRPSLYRICKAFSASERKAVEKVAEQFFPVNDDGLRHNARADSEIAKAKAYADAQAMRANMRWHKQPHKPEQCPADANHNHNHTKPKTPLPPSGAFLRFWAAWPRGPRKKAQGKCWEVWQRRDFEQSADQILSHVESMKSTDDWGRGFVCAPLVYLNQRQWEGAELDHSHSPKVDV